ncbi:DUF2357 domain-containing protein [Flavobacterium microcysteis]|uniref:DUF2357 domain-containing protein n=1 Tax=Flavobacterium microcysteis TaxID=2596891 RepID=A0A501Q4P4_9FLAO|nr:DUF2357 domain-containing protein [Flavobacterium microcysteis]TPD67304.1 DUF2357 domain-containing protein [Flavobacterium microcysteis]
MKNECLKILLDEIESGLILSVFPEGRSDFRIIDSQDALLYSESIYQVLEGNSYEYSFNKNTYQLKASVPGIIIPSKTHISSGRMVPNIYVGTLTLEIEEIALGKPVYNLDIEVLATKFNRELDKSYRENYRFMLESITDKCTELLMQINTPIYQTFDINFDCDCGTIYQRFCFVQSIIDNSIFTESIERIIINPKTNWETESETADIRKIRRINNHSLRQIISGSNRILLSEQHLMQKFKIYSVPLKINSFRKIENSDTPENRFIKYVLETFKQFCDECLRVFQKFKMTKPSTEATYLSKKLDFFLNHTFFKDINPPTSLKLNSPVLQKRSGYREVLNRWLQFDFASKLIWKGGDDVYKAGKKDIATLYEYWLFFTLYDLIKEKFEIESIIFDEKVYKHLITETNDGLNVMLKSGKHTALEGNLTKRNRDLNIKFSYNRTFKGGIPYQNKVSGSWTTPMRPDFTLSAWPKMFSEEQAEANESIVHIHFDGKYKVDNFYRTAQLDLEGIDLEQELSKVSIDERKGNYKNIDLLKMHAYKDAIRRSGGAYILYPDINEKPFRGFHEIIPGLGAFSVNPSPDSDVRELSNFLDLIIDHLLDKTSQREQLSDEINKIFKKTKSDADFLHDRIPEFSGTDRLIIDKISVIIGFYKNIEQLNWILKNNLYNLRTSTYRGSFRLTKENIDAKYLILHGKNELKTNKIYKLKSAGPKVYSKNDLIKKHYPEPKGQLYFIYEIEGEVSDDFGSASFDLRQLTQFENFRNSATPFTVKLTELLKTKLDK